MSIRKILTYPDKKLRNKASSILVEDILKPSFQKLITDLTTTMFHDDGVGIAATQIGEPYQIFILGRKTPEESLVFINPRITFFSRKTNFTEEGCLSVPGIFGLVKRPVKVRLKALDRTGKKIDMKISGFDAKVIQHEFDHLQGILFIDKVEKITQGDIKALESGKIPVSLKRKTDVAF